MNTVRRENNFQEASKAFKNHEPRTPAFTVFRELCRIPGIDQQMRIEANDGSDIQHAIIALAYCDFALLDKKWVDFASRVQRKLRKLKVALTLATALSKRDMPDFLTRLEQHPNLGSVRAVN